MNNCLLFVEGTRTHITEIVLQKKKSKNFLVIRDKSNNLYITKWPKSERAHNIVMKLFTCSIANVFILLHTVHIYVPISNDLSKVSKMDSSHLYTIHLLLNSLFDLVPCTVNVVARKTRTCRFNNFNPGT